MIAHGHFIDYRTLLVRVSVQDSIIRTQDSVIVSLEALLHIQEVDMVGFSTLCYLKTPAGEKTDSGSDNQ